MSTPQTPQPPPSPPKPNPPGGEGGGGGGDAKPSATRGPEQGSKKKARLQWDEKNLMLNAAEMERAAPRMKIDEPKTPYTAGSENGSSTSGSAHQSPPESPSFIPRDNLVGFSSLEQRMRRGSSGNASDGASSTGSAARSVHIDDSVEASAGSSPRTRELFAAKRRAHYRNEARVREWIPQEVPNAADQQHSSDTSDDEDDIARRGSVVDAAVVDATVIDVAGVDAAVGDAVQQGQVDDTHMANGVSDGEASSVAHSADQNGQHGEGMRDQDAQPDENTNGSGKHGEGGH